VEGLIRRNLADVARAFGYSPGSFQVLCHHFRRDTDPVFFVSPRPGPRDQPKKSAARDLIVELRKRNYSVYEISESLKERQLSLSPTAVREVLKVEGFAPYPGRLDRSRLKGCCSTSQPPMPNSSGLRLVRGYELFAMGYVPRNSSPPSRCATHWSPSNRYSQVRTIGEPKSLPLRALVFHDFAFVPVVFRKA
jgi:hypothetical protein